MFEMLICFLTVPKIFRFHLKIILSHFYHSDLWFQRCENLGKYKSVPLVRGQSGEKRNLKLMRK